MVKMSLALFAAWAVLGQSAYAQVHYTCNDPVGTIQTCRGSNGNMYTVMKDAAGATVTDTEGHMSRIQNDPVMGAVIHRQDGSSVRSHADALGNTVYEDNEGRQTRCRPTPFPIPGQTDMDCQ
jgi:hypothetical protein